MNVAMGKDGKVAGGASHCGAALMLLAASALALAGGCQTPERAFRQIELGKKLDGAALPLFASQSRNGASYEHALVWILPVSLDFTILHVLKDDDGIVVAKSLYQMRGCHWGLTATVDRNYLLETTVSPEYLPQAAKDWNGEKLFSAAFPWTTAETRKTLNWKISEALIPTCRKLGRAMEAEDAKVPGELPPSLAAMREQVWQQIVAAAAADKNKKLPQPQKNLPTSLAMTMVMLETLGANRSQRSAQDISFRLFVWPFEVFEIPTKAGQVLDQSPPPEMSREDLPFSVVGAPPAVFLYSLRSRRIGAGNVSVEMENHLAAGLFAETLVPKRSATSRPATQPAK
jgi:hypothetical protein